MTYRDAIKLKYDHYKLIGQPMKYADGSLFPKNEAIQGFIIAEPENVLDIFMKMYDQDFTNEQALDLSDTDQDKFEVYIYHYSVNGNLYYELLMDYIDSSADQGDQPSKYI